jgi:hypothetical protein
MLVCAILAAEVAWLRQEIRGHVLLESRRPGFDDVKFIGGANGIGFRIPDDTDVVALNASIRQVLRLHEQTTGLTGLSCELTKLELNDHPHVHLTLGYDRWVRHRLVLGRMRYVNDRFDVDVADRNRRIEEGISDVLRPIVSPHDVDGWVTWDENMFR